MPVLMYGNHKKHIKFMLFEITSVIGNLSSRLQTFTSDIGNLSNYFYRKYFR